MTSSANIILFLLACLVLIMSCAPSQESIQTEQPYPKAVSLRQAPDKLTQELIASTRGKEAGRVGVLGLTGPGGSIAELGEYLADKLSGAMYQSGAGSLY